MVAMSIIAGLAMSFGEGSSDRSGMTAAQMSELKELGANVAAKKTGVEIYVFVPVSDKLIDRITELKRVTLLSFGLEAQPTAAQLSRISSLRDLRHFRMAFLSGDPGASLSFVKDLPQLERVSVSTSDIGVAQLKQAPWLKSVDLSNSKLSNESLGDLGQIKELETLYLSATKITGNLEALCELEQLSELSLSDNEIGDDALISFLNSFKGRSKLKALFLSGSGITDRSMEYIAKCDSIMELSLTSSKVTARGLRNMTACVQLRRLLVDDMKLEAAEIDELCKLRSLHHLYVTKANFRKSWAARIEKALPDCNLHQVGPEEM